MRRREAGVRLIDWAEVEMAPRRCCEMTAGWLTWRGIGRRLLDGGGPAVCLRGDAAPRVGVGSGFGDGGI